MAADRLTVAVSDHDPRLPHLQPMEPTATTGRGLAMVEAMSDGWGTDLLPGRQRQGGLVRPADADGRAEAGAAEGRRAPGRGARPRRPSASPSRPRSPDRADRTRGRTRAPRHRTGRRFAGEGEAAAGPVPPRRGAAGPRVNRRAGNPTVTPSGARTTAPPYRVRPCRSQPARAAAGVAAQVPAELLVQHGQPPPVLVLVDLARREPPAEHRDRRVLAVSPALPRPAPPAPRGPPQRRDHRATTATQISGKNRIHGPGPPLCHASVVIARHLLGRAGPPDTTEPGFRRRPSRPPPSGAPLLPPQYRRPSATAPRESVRRCRGRPAPLPTPGHPNGGNRQGRTGEHRGQRPDDGVSAAGHSVDACGRVPGCDGGRTGPSGCGGIPSTGCGRARCGSGSPCGWRWPRRPVAAARVCGGPAAARRARTPAELPPEARRDQCERCSALDRTSSVAADTRADDPQPVRRLPRVLRPRPAQGGHHRSRPRPSAPAGAGRSVLHLPRRGTADDGPPHRGGARRGAAHPGPGVGHGQTRGPPPPARARPARGRTGGLHSG